MRILHLINTFDYCDGCARHLLFLAEVQKGRGYDVSVAVGGGDATELLREAGIECEIIPSIRHESRSLWSYLSGAISLRKLVRSLRPDIVHAHHYYAAHESISARHAVPQILTIHANFPDDGWLSKYPGEAFIAVSESIKRIALERMPSVGRKIVVVPNASRFLGIKNEGASVTALQRAAENRQGKLLVAFAGRLVKVKGVDLLLTVLSHVKKEIPSVCLLAGEGPEEDALRALAARLHVDARFIGRMRDIYPLLDLADVLVLPSLRAEGLPMTLLEAGLAGKAVVASRTDGVPEVIEDGVSGLLVTPGDTTELEAALRRLSLNPELRRKLGEGLQRKTESYTVAQMAEGVEGAYRSLLRLH